MKLIYILTTTETTSSALVESAPPNPLD